MRDCSRAAAECAAGQANHYRSPYSFAVRTAIIEPSPQTTLAISESSFRLAIYRGFALGMHWFASVAPV